MPSLPASDVAFETLPPVSPPLRIIFMAGVGAGGGVWPVVGGLEMLVNDCGKRQKGVRNILTDPAVASTWCVMW